MSTLLSRNILVAPLNWGLGHAARCIPIIRQLSAHGFTPILASDGDALELLRKEFPELQILELPSYQIEYSKNGSDFKWKMLKNLPNMIEAMRAEKKVVKKWVKEYNLAGIISDNRLGVFSKKIPSVFITHQLNVLTGNTSWLTGIMHRSVIDRFAECWVPDSEGLVNLSGKLGHLEQPWEKVRYIGPLSRFEKKDETKMFDLTIVLSGPEPQRTILEDILKKEVRRFKGKVLMIRGVVGPKQTVRTEKNLIVYNFMTSDELETALNQSRLVLSRSGYTTVMDLAKLGLKAFFIPTPGQYEQEYLARKFKNDGVAPSTKQDKFTIEKLIEVDLYKGLPHPESDVDWESLFSLFERE